MRNLLLFMCLLCFGCASIDTGSPAPKEVVKYAPGDTVYVQLKDTVYPVLIEIADCDTASIPYATHVEVKRANVVIIQRATDVWVVDADTVMVRSATYVEH